MTFNCLIQSGYRVFIVLIAHCSILLGSLWAAQSPAPADAQIAAKVDNEPIYVAEVSRMLENVTRAQKIAPEALPVLKAQSLDEAIDRRLALAYARRTKSSPTQKEIDAAWEKFKVEIAAKGTTVDRYLKQQSQTEADARRKILWDLTWDKLKSKSLTDERAETYFNAHRHDFDGTEISVSHILLKPKAGADANANAALISQAEAIREDILAEKISFADAARKYSSGPSAEKGGDQGFIGRRGPMVESFSKAAFALEPGQISKPVVTPFGVHLILCKEIKPGKKSLSDARKEVDDAMARELLESLADQQRKYSTVQYTGNWPYFKPGTTEILGSSK
jgi:peptidyl-prolyl cis-trans isomerase C